METRAFLPSYLCYDSPYCATNYICGDRVSFCICKPMQRGLQLVVEMLHGQCVSCDIRDGIFDILFLQFGDDATIYYSDILWANESDLICDCVDLRRGRSSQLVGDTKENILYDKS